MKRTLNAPRAPARLRLLLAVLVLALGAFATYWGWLAPEAREARYARMSGAQLEKEAGRSQDPILFYFLARRRLELGDAPGAVDAFETVLRLDPGYRGARAALGSTLVSLDRDDEGALQLRQAVQNDPTDVNAYLGLALLHERHGAWSRAAEAAETATRVQPDLSDAWVLRGDAAVGRRDTAEAARFYEKAASLAPRSARALSLAAQTHLNLGDFDRAEDSARRAVAAGPADPAGPLALGRVLLRRERERLPEAVQSLERAIALGETGGAAYQYLGDALLAQQHAAEAEQEDRLALRADPQRNGARYGLARALRLQGKGGEADEVERDFRRWTRFAERRVVLNDRVALDRDNSGAWFALARLYADMGLWADARRTVRSGLRRAPADPAGLNLLAEADHHAP